MTGAEAATIDADTAEEAQQGQQAQIRAPPTTVITWRIDMDGPYYPPYWR